MAKISESIKVECRTPNEYYEISKVYERDGYELIESDDPNVLSFEAIKTHKVWE